MIPFFLNSGWFTLCVRKKLGVKELTVYVTLVQFNKCTLSQRQRDGQELKLLLKELCHEIQPNYVITKCPLNWEKRKKNRLKH